MMNIDFTGKTALVTGGTRGIGQEIAERLYALGANLIITGTSQKQIDALNAASPDKSRKRFLRLNFLEDGSVDIFLQQIQVYPVIDILVNNAGINRINPIDQCLMSDWDDIIKVNLTGPFQLSKEIGGLMKKQQYGRIVNIASVFGVITREKRSVYTTTKSGLIGMTKTVSVDLAPHGVLVNAVSPGFIGTELTMRILKQHEIESLREAVPMRRLGTTGDIANVVLFLASDFNTYITGQNIVVDGGYVNI
jgi:3-oxoacyl-[acyl-carrier protein] reductase